jgi:hypothetical protein
MIELYTSLYVYLDGRAWWRIAISLWLGVLLLFEWWRARRLPRRRGVDVSQRMTPSLPEQPSELAYVHLNSEVLNDELYLVHRALSQRERPTGHPCYTIPEAEVIRFVGPDVMAVIQLVKVLLVAPLVGSRHDQTDTSRRNNPATGGG